MSQQEPEQDAALEPGRWGTLLTLLSMDITQPFLRPMGLEPPDAPRLMALIRECILENRKQYEAQNAPPPPIAQRTLERIRHVFGAEFAHELRSWGEGVFKWRPQDGLDLRHWQFVLALARRPHERWEFLFASPERQVQVLEHFERALDVREAQKLSRQLEASPLSEWDMQMYARHRFDEDTRSPFLWLLGTVRHHQLCQFWRWLCTTLSLEELDYLWRAGQQFSQAHQELKFIQELKHPLKTLEEQ